MQARKIFLRVSKILGKAILGLLLFLLIVVLIIHTPPLQKQITRTASKYLTSKIEAKVEIGRINFSILGDVTIEGLKIWNPEKISIFSAREIEVTSNIFDLISGNIIFDKVHIAGVSGQLVNDEEGLNIQFIIDAFQQKESSDSKPATATFKFNTVVLEDIVFDYKSTTGGTTLSSRMGTFTSQNAEVTISPNRISADKLYLENTVINILYEYHPDTLNTSVTTNNNELILPDFGTGIAFEVKDVELKNDNFSLHRNEVTNTPKFDPHHIDLKQIQLSLSEILIREDTLAVVLKTLSAQLPGFNLRDAGAAIQLNRNLLVLSNLHVTSNTNELKANFRGGYDLKSSNDDAQAQVEITAMCKVNPADLAYFFSDSVIKHFSHWGQTALTLEGKYNHGKGEIATLNLKTQNSQIQAKGIINNAFEPDKINWKEVDIHASIGSDFKRTLAPFVQSIEIPPDLSLQVNSSGDPRRLYVDGKAFTTWGDATAIGFVMQPADHLAVDINLTGDKVDLGKWMKISSLGPIDLDVDAKGIISNDPDVKINGLISSIEVLNETIQKIDFQGRFVKNSLTSSFSIEDPKYRSEVISELSFAGPLVISNDIRFHDFSAGTLLQYDTTLSISGVFKSEIKIDQSSIAGYVEGDSVLLKNHVIENLLDTLSFHALISPTRSEFEYHTDNAKGKLVSNFDVRDSRNLFQTWTVNIFKGSDNSNYPAGNRAIDIELELENANVLQLMGVDVDDFSSLNITGGLDEQKQTLALQATSGNFKGYGVSLDTLSTYLAFLRDSIGGSITAKNLFYNSVQLGDLDFDVLTKSDTIISNLVLSRDAITTLGLGVSVLPTDSGIVVYPDKLSAFELDYFVDRKNPVYINNKNVAFNHFQITRDAMGITLDGDLNAFDVNLRNVDLTSLNFLLSTDTTIINKGRLTGRASYARDKQLDVKAQIDSLSLYNSNPLTVAVTAVSNKNQVPFEFLLTNASNKVDMKGLYFLDTKEMDASLQLDVNNLELFSFLVSGFISKMNGSIKGETKVTGRIDRPSFKGSLRFLDVGLTTVNPTLTLNVRDDIIRLDNSALLLNDFTLYDKENNPLTINGNVTSPDYKSFAYDLQINSDQYTLFSNPDTVGTHIHGLLVIGSDIKLTGNERDTNVKAKVIIKGTTNLTFVTSNDDIELLKSEGIIDFVDPKQLLDSATSVLSSYFYDSLIASLPDFNLNSTVTIEDDAVIRVIVDSQSGDFIEASGGANLELGYDRTGNLNLSGNYTIKNGVYRLSFYDLVKKNFTLVQGSSINWSGTPENGEMDIKATYIVESNSIGLIGHEIGENEKSIYKRSLDYEVGINIKGTIEKPIVSFSLDLPQGERVNYPVLSNKLDRLKLPEYESELNKQVFGLLVLGGFLPETSGSDINSNVIATTALSNSVNSLLASQLNRFASQYVKGVNIDVGIQSYSDYSAPGGKTRTAMDFRVSKSILNDRLSFEIGGDFDINQDQSGTNTGNKNYRGDIAIIYDLTGRGDKQLKLFNNETYDIIYQEIRNTGISLVFIREFDRNKKSNTQEK